MLLLTAFTALKPAQFNLLDEESTLLIRDDSDLGSEYRDHSSDDEVKPDIIAMKKYVATRFD